MELGAFQLLFLFVVVPSFGVKVDAVPGRMLSEVDLGSSTVDVRHPHISSIRRFLADSAAPLAPSPSPLPSVSSNSISKYGCYDSYGNYYYNCGSSSGWKWWSYFVIVVAICMIILLCALYCIRQRRRRALILAQQNAAQTGVPVGQQAAYPYPPQGQYPMRQYPGQNAPDGNNPYPQYPDQQYPNQQYPNQQYPDQQYPNQHQQQTPTGYPAPTQP